MKLITFTNTITGDTQGFRWDDTMYSADDLATFTAQQLATGRWGQASHWVNEVIEGVVTRSVVVTPDIPAVTHQITVIDTAAVLDSNGNVVTPAVTHQETVVDHADVPEVDKTQYLKPDDYTIVTTDITAQVVQEQQIAKGLAAQQTGQNVMALVYALNEANLASGSLSTAQFQALVSDANVGKMQALLLNGSLATALALFTATQSSWSAYYTADQLASITAAIQAGL